MNKFLLTAMAVIAGCALAACSNDNEPNENQAPRHEIALNASQKQLAGGINDMAYRLWDVMAAESTGSNEFLSPLGMHSVLAMLANGAQGETRAQICDLTGSDNVAALNELHKILLAELPLVDKNVSFKMANSVWSAEGLTILPEYKDACSGAFDASTFSYKPGTTAAMDAVNNWCKNKTNGMIPNFLSHAPENNFMLLNALYFEGKWNTPFEPSSTQADRFYNADGSSSEVMMMNETINTNGVNSDKAYMINLPYSNCGFVMDLVLPKEGYSLSDLDWRTLDSDAGDREKHRPVAVTLGLPRFALDMNADFPKYLEALGYKAICNNSNYSGINTQFFSIALDVMQKSRLEVEESGTRVSSVSMVEGFTAPMPEELTLLFNRPFMLRIRETSTGVVLFMGKIEKL